LRQDIYRKISTNICRVMIIFREYRRREALSFLVVVTANFYLCSLLSFDIVILCITIFLLCFVLFIVRVFYFVSVCDVRDATLTEVFPCFFLSCKANARV
jgi:hypothetical protein